MKKNGEINWQSRKNMSEGTAWLTAGHYWRKGKRRTIALERSRTQREGKNQRPDVFCELMCSPRAQIKLDSIFLKTIKIKRQCNTTIVYKYVIFFYIMVIKCVNLRFQIFFFKQQTRKILSIHKQDVYLVFNRSNWLLAIENNNCNHLKLKGYSSPNWKWSLFTYLHVVPTP